jgi:hypothetical protein
MEIIFFGMGLVAGIIFTMLSGINKPVDCKVTDSSKVIDCSDMSDEDLETMKFIKEGFKR